MAEETVVMFQVARSRVSLYAGLNHIPFLILSVTYVTI
jgi:hypothetical protein